MSEYRFPGSIAEAVELLNAHDGRAQIIAGGTDVIADIRKRKISPQVLVDITRVPGLDEIEVEGDSVKIGAAVTFAQMKDSSYLARHVHALVDAARSVGAIGIQTAATWVGNIVQAMPAADGAIIALALDAEAHVADRHGAVWQPVKSLFEGPGVSAVDPTRQLITHLRFRVPRPPWGTAWQRVGRRPSLVLPILNCAVTVCLDETGTRITSATIALGPVAPRPFRSRGAETYLKDKPPSAEAFAHAARIAQQESNPRSSVMRASRDYRLAIIRPLIKAALLLAAERATMGRTYDSNQELTTL